MRAARVKPVDQTSEMTTPRPQLVPARTPAQVPAKGAEIKELHPLLTLLIAAVIAFTGATIFVGSIATALLLRNSGVNWLFERF